MPFLAHELLKDDKGDVQMNKFYTLLCSVSRIHLEGLSMLIFFFFCFGLFRATPAAYGGSQDRGQI